MIFDLLGPMAPDAVPNQEGIKRYFFVQSFSFACVGIDPTSLERTIVNTYMAWWPMMSLLFLCFPIVIYASQYITDLDLVTDALSPIWQASLAIMKLMYFIWNKEKIIKLVRRIWLMNVKVVFTTGVLALVSPFVIAFFYHLKGLGFRENLGPPLKAAYFPDTKSHLGYAIAYLWNVSGIYFVINGNLAIDSLYSWFMHNVVAQFRILKLHFKSDANTVRHRGDEEEFRQLIVDRIKHHRRVIELEENFNDVYKIIVFIKFTISFIQIAFLAYQFARGRELSAQLFHLFFLISVSMQLILYCNGGQRIKDESTSVAVFIYDYFKWHDLSIKTKKLLLLPLMRAQKPCIVTGVFFEADLSLFLWKKMRLLLKPKSAADALPPQYGLKTYFVVQNFAFNCMGIDVTSQNRTIFNPFINWISMALLMTLCVFMFMYAAEYRHDMDLMTDILAPFWQAVLALIKMWVFVWNKKRVVKLVRHIWLWNLEGRADELDIIIDENRKDYFYSKLFFRFVMATVVMAFLSPILVAFFYYLKGQGFMDNLDPPLKAGVSSFIWVTYYIAMDPKSYNGYILIYIWNIISVCYISNGAIANDTLFSWIAHNVTAQFRILNLRFKKTANSLRKPGDEREFIRSITQHIKYHHRVIELANNFNDVFMVTVFFKYTISFLQIACLIFTIARGGELATLVFHIVFLIAVSIQLMMYCLGGQKIIDGSTSVAVSIYEYFQWHDMSIKSKKLLLLSIMRAQKPCNLTGVFFVADLPLFLWVLKTSGSMFTMLKSMEA
ncbi:uncharacterized protein LOC119608988 [Lucilia sericata]|uniref:uncharacterized protein LOC119608988 n=1 Tax=Lucilia sericata TaxID=13632 RepID=UPI0018A82A8E|nr:uncharacterized protein LOC119608988 [Lucilia sericata]